MGLDMYAMTTSEAVPGEVDFKVQEENEIYYWALNQRSCHQVQLQPETSSMPSRAPMSKGKMPYGLTCP